MCFHNSMSAKAIKVAARYGRKSDVVEIYQSILDEQYHVNAFTFPRYPIITSSDEVQVFNWGLIPFWVRSEEDATEIRKMTLNARADTIFEKPSFREPIMKKRCIAPSTGYFEWRHEGANKIPYYIYSEYYSYNRFNTMYPIRNNTMQATAMLINNTMICPFLKKPIECVTFVNL